MKYTRRLTAAKSFRQVAAPATFAGITQKQKLLRIHPKEFCLCWHLLIFPGRRQPSIVSASELNFRVRDGNGCTLTAIDTNYLL